MVAEIEQWRIEGSKDILERYEAIPSGSVEAIDFFGPEIKLLVSCGIDNLKTTVMILGESSSLRNIKATVFKSENDNDDGEDVKIDEGPCVIEKPWELSMLLFEPRRDGHNQRIIKEIVVYFPNDDSYLDDEIPQQSKPLILV